MKPVRSGAFLQISPKSLGPAGPFIKRLPSFPQRPFSSFHLREMPQSFPTLSPVWNMRSWLPWALYSNPRRINLRSTLLWIPTEQRNRKWWMYQSLRWQRLFSNEASPQHNWGFTKLSPSFRHYFTYFFLWLHHERKRVVRSFTEMNFIMNLICWIFLHRDVKRRTPRRADEVCWSCWWHLRSVPAWFHVLNIVLMSFCLNLWVEEKSSTYSGTTETLLVMDLRFKLEPGECNQMSTLFIKKKNLCGVQLKLQWSKIEANIMTQQSRSPAWKSAQ